jgi:putative sigma-54 modulation protein
LEITVSARHTDVSSALHDAVLEKIGRLSRFLEGMDRAEVHFSEERNPRITDREVCEVVLEGHGHHVRCKVAAHDGFAAIDKAVDKLEHQLHKLKTKLQRRHHGGPRGRVATNGDVAPSPSALAVADDDTDLDGDGPRIVKVKRHGLKPMLPDEAALQLDLLGHGFYFFTNAETGRAAVLYRRADGDLGLIDEAGSA